MRLITFSATDAGVARAGLRVRGGVLDIAAASKSSGTPLPSAMRALLAAGEAGLASLRSLLALANDDPARFAPQTLAEGSFQYLPPVPDADKFICVGKNYRAHLEELKRTDLIKEMPQEVTGFVKLNSCLTGHLEKVVRPADVPRLDYEPELVFVIGKRALGVKRDDNPLQYVAGVTILNDLTDRDMQKREVASGSRFWTAKNAPGFGPLGPEIVTMDEIADPYDLWITCSVNGEERMRVNTRDQIWRIGDILQHFSRHMPILPGDMMGMWREKC